MRKTATGPLLLALIGGSALGIAEGIVRVRHPEATHSATLARIERERNSWRRPDARFHHVGDGNFALRFAEPTEGADRRLLIVGDSFAMGHGVERDQRFGSLLQRRFGDELTIDVLATSSYSPIIYRNIVRQALSAVRYAGVAVFVDQTDPPDDVIYRNDLLPDADRRHFDVELMTERVALVDQTYDRIERDLSGWRGVVRRSALFNHLRPASLSASFPKDTAHYDYVRLSLSRSLLIQTFQDAPHHEATLVMESLLFRHLDEILQLCRERQIPVVLAANPWEFQVSGTPRTRQGFSGPYPRENRLELILVERYRAAGDVTVVPLTEAFREHRDPSSLFLDRPRNEIHWNAEGHALVERTLGAMLEQRTPQPAGRDSLPSSTVRIAPGGDETDSGRSVKL